MKLGLGSVSMFFDVLFMIQHYILYPEHSEAPVSEPLVLDSIEKQECKHSHAKLVSLNSIKTP